MARSPLTPARRARLEKLAAYLEGLPADYQHFDMRAYITAEGPPVIEYAAKNGGIPGCGSVACAVGHGPAAGILMPRSLLKIMEGDRFSPEDMRAWNKYAALFVGEKDGWADSVLFEWLFGSDWRGSDNSHHGAAARIRYLLDKGKPPEDFADALFADEETLALYAPYRVDTKALADA